MFSSSSPQRGRHIIFIMLMMGLVWLIISSFSAAAQDTVTIEGKIEDIPDPSTIIIDGQTIIIRNVTLPPPLRVGMMVRITGILQRDDIIMADTLTILSTATSTPPPDDIITATDSSTLLEARQHILIIEGPIENIEENIVTIFGFDLALDPQEPLLLTLQVGDYLRVEGHMTDGTLTVQTPTLVDIGLSDDGQVTPPMDVWVDDGDCNNPPPPWIPALSWRQRCGNVSGFEPTPRSQQ